MGLTFIISCARPLGVRWFEAAGIQSWGSLDGLGSQAGSHCYPTFSGQALGVSFEREGNLLGSVTVGCMGLQHQRQFRTEN